MLREENLCCLEEMLHVSKSVLTTNICFKQTLLVYFLQKVAHLLTQRALTAAPPSWNEGTTKGKDHSCLLFTFTRLEPLCLLMCKAGYYCTADGNRTPDQVGRGRAISRWL